MSWAERGRGETVNCRIPVRLVEHLDRAAVARGSTRFDELVQRLEASMVGESFGVHGGIVRRSVAAGNALGEALTRGHS